MPQTVVGSRKVHYVDSGGDGIPVVLVHGFPFDSSLWERQIEALGDRFRLIAPDLPGFGSSDVPADPGEYSVDAWADDVKGVLDDLGIDQAVLAGLSMGGYVVFAFHRKYPDAVRALVLADTRADADPPEAIEKRTNQQAQVRAEGTAGLIEGLTGALLGATTKEKRPDVVETVKGYMDNPADGYVGALEAMKQRPDSTGDLTGINVPTLVIAGEEDTLIPVDFARTIHEHVGGSRLVVLPEAGHISNVEAPEAFNGALAEFLNEL